MNQAGSPPAWLPRVVNLLLFAAGLLTAVLVVRTFWYFFQAVTNAPVTDTWFMLDQVRSFREGASGWTALWAPYWGQRILVPRLLFLVSLKYFSFAALPLLLVNLAAELFLVGVLISTARRLFRDSPRVFMACAIAFTSLTLSCLSMEVLVFTQVVQHSVGYACAVSAILLFERRPWLAVGLAAITTGSMAIGLLIWPVLLVQAWHGGARVRTLVVLCLLIVAMSVLYADGYTRPEEMGMGVAGAILHPSMTALVLGGPITLYSLRLGTVAGAIGLAVLVWVLFAGKRETFPLKMAACFLTACAASLVVGRISPEWLASLHGAQPLPSRYMLPVLIFWGCLLALVMAQRQVLPRIVVGMIVLILAFGTWPWQWRVSREWAAAFQKFDAIASGFLVNVDDPELMSLLVTEAPLRDRTAEYMRREHLAIFAESRAAWIGKPLPAGAHSQAVEVSTVAIQNGLRISGTLQASTRRPLDVLIADDHGMVIGLARTLAAESEGHRATSFLGYARTPSPDILRYYLLD